MKEARAKARRPAPPPTAMTVLKPFSDGRATEPKFAVIWERITAATALANDVPTAGMRVLRLFAAPVWDAGTAPMTRAGMAPKVKPTPTS
jgi:hypothetical protein